ncbi:hypothetical protein DCAR_0100570 [Daucus carota subsp. sativus]|uniref:Uncharacterized protein n=1 Tax=Daucus carota subsp. sativus TaxID=79200 RepID=A0AAF0W487_DAUCS|nr:hypothetical protein DCAR_0100570 [Daucus carota subsp. sativus]
MGVPMDLDFRRLQSASLAFAIVLTSLTDGTQHYLIGVVLCLAYVVLAACFNVSHESQRRGYRYALDAYLHQHIVNLHNHGDGYLFSGMNSDPDVNTAIGSGICQTSNYNADIQVDPRTGDTGMVMSLNQRHATTVTLQNTATSEKYISGKFSSFQAWMVIWWDSVSREMIYQDEKEASNFILIDRAPKRMIGTTATKLTAILLKKKTPNAFPKKATELTGKEVRLQIEINKDNVVSKSKLFVATDAYESRVSYSGISSTSFTESNMIQGFFCLFIIY